MRTHPGQYLYGECSAHSDYVCKLCPAHANSQPGSTERSQCTCNAGYFDASTAAQGVSCQPCKKLCGSNQYQSVKCGAVDTVHGQDSVCTECPSHSSLKHSSGRRLFGVSQPPQIQDCVCDKGYFDDKPKLSEVHCVEMPQRFGSTYTNPTCQFQKFGLGRTQRIDLNTSPSDTAMIGSMVQFLHGVSSDVLYSADFNDLCGLIMTAYHGIGTICGAVFPLFGKNGNTAEHANFLGNVAVQCHNFVDLFVINKICVEPCMHEEKGCCWMPTDLSRYFGCCAKLGCCGPTNGPTKAPTPTPITVTPTSRSVSIGCKDLYPTCALLKKQLDAFNGSCFEDDLGQLTGEVEYKGKHLADGCCATCQPDENTGCTKCLATGQQRAFCNSIGACKSECVYPEKCTECIKVVTLVQCQSFGVNCVQICDESTVHRRTQSSGVAVGTQVTANSASATQFKVLMECLAKGSSVQGCTLSTKNA